MRGTVISPLYLFKHQQMVVAFGRRQGWCFGLWYNQAHRSNLVGGGEIRVSNICSLESLGVLQTTVPTKGSRVHLFCKRKKNKNHTGIGAIQTPRGCNRMLNLLTPGAMGPVYFRHSATIWKPSNFNLFSLKVSRSIRRNMFYSEQCLCKIHGI